MIMVPWQTAREMWETSYIHRHRHYHTSPVFECYEYEVSIELNEDFIAPKNLSKMEEYCFKHFGDLNECDSRCRWQVCRDERNEKNGSFYKRIPLLVFLFHNEEDAMAFKLRWA